jgi:hypothetical protein
MVFLSRRWTLNKFFFFLELGVGILITQDGRFFLGGIE